MTTSIGFDVFAKDRASTTFNKVGNTADFASRKTEAMTRTLKRAAVGIGIAATAAATFGAKAGAAYVDRLNKIQVLTDSGDAKMRNTAKTLESNAFLYAKMGMSVGDAADGVVELTKAGLRLKPAMAAVNGTMVLAKAGEMGVAEASTLVSNTLNTFGLKAKRAADVANYLANAANISSADVVDLAEAFKYVAPVAAASGVKVQTVSAMLAQLANKGINASVAGTGLRNLFVSLQAPSGAAAKALKNLGVSVFDADGKARPFKRVLDDLAVAVKKTDDETRKADLKAIFGKQGLNAAQVLLDGGVKALNAYEKDVTKAGAASRFAASNSKGLLGTLKTLKSLAVSTAQSFYRQFSPVVDKALQPLVDKLGNLGTAMSGSGGQKLVADLAAVFNNALIPAAKALAGVLPSLSGMMHTAGSALGFMADHSTATKRVIIALVAGIAAYKVGIVGYVAWTKAAAAVEFTRTAAVKLSTSTFGTRVGVLALDAAAWVRSTAATVAHTTATVAANIAGKAMAIGLKAWAAAQWLLNAALTANPIGLIVVGIGALIAGIVLAWRHSETFRTVVTAAWSGIKVATVATFDVVKKVIATAFKLIARVFLNFTGPGLIIKHWNTIRAVTTAAWGAIRGAVSGAVGAIKTKVGQAVGFFVALPGQIVGALAGIGGKLVQKGRDLVQGFINGIKEAPGKIKDALLGLLPGPLKKFAGKLGLASPSKLFRRWGRWTVDGYNGGVRDRYAASATTMDRWAGGVAAGAAKSLKKRNIKLTSAGAMLIEGLVKGIDSRKVKLKNALGKVADYVKAMGDKLKSLQDERAGYLSTFSADSVFSTDLSGGGGFNALLANAMSTSSKAAGFNKNIQTLIGNKLSGNLLKQLQSQGFAAADQVAALAKASPAQIAMLNALDAQTSASLQSAGLGVGNAVRGGSIDRDIAATQQALAVGQAVEKALGKVKLEAHIHLEGRTIKQSLEAYDRKKGKGK